MVTERDTFPLQQRGEKKEKQIAEMIFLLVYVRHLSTQDVEHLSNEHSFQSYHLYSRVTKSISPFPPD